jgi:hypothetical protein
VKFGVQGHIGGKRFVAPVLGIQHTVDGIQTARGSAQQGFIHPALGRHARRQTFQRAAQLDGVRTSASDSTRTL